MRTDLILGISGSLSEGSSNSAVISALADQVSGRVNFVSFIGLELLQPFNPQVKSIPPEVANFRALLSSASAVVISTPEYAYGMPGILKNALDWVVFSGELYQKPVAAVSVSTMETGGERALLSLLSTLSALGTKTPKYLTLSIGNSRSKISETGKILDGNTVLLLQLLTDQLLELLEVKI
ncbi:NADPH-dependent FMN reductase [Flavobacterium sp. UBA7682]|uniref:NADPH-dependent FMN reductase n=1 Tax=Flavobacterium sp. UBA7682 TaxID=1946560 RepID=UPI0025BFFB15|nr:NADPH-dependent FMN reductase [Flavobacterium sp. UBA7682]